jgi:hypothetical protein
MVIKHVADLFVEYADAFSGNDVVKALLKCLNLVFNAFRKLVHRHQTHILLLVVLGHSDVATIFLDENITDFPSMLIIKLLKLPSTLSRILLLTTTTKKQMKLQVTMLLWSSALKKIAEIKP